MSIRSFINSSRGDAGHSAQSFRYFLTTLRRVSPLGSLTQTVSHSRAQGLLHRTRALPDAVLTAVPHVHRRRVYPECIGKKVYQGGR